MPSPAARRLLSGAVGVVAISLLVAGLIAAAGGWNHWRAARYAARATVLDRAGAKDAARKAGLRALKLNRDSLAATRLLLDLVPVSDPNTALLLRSRVADLQPTDRENLRELADVAIHAKRFDLAEQAARDLSRGDGTAAESLKIRMRILAARGDFAGAGEVAKEVQATDPEDNVARLILALERVFQDSASAADRQELADLAASPDLRLEALRGLRELATRGGNRSEALRLAEEITRELQADFVDWLSWAEFAIKIEPLRVEELTNELTLRAGQDSQALAQIATWLRRHGYATKVPSWVAATPALRQDSTSAALILAQHYATEGDWQSLQLLAAAEHWQKLEFLRRALLARAARGRGDEPSATREWRASVEDALNDASKVRALGEIARDWREWETEVEEMLWRAARVNLQAAGWALTQLQNRAAARRDTRALRKVSETMLQAFPNNDHIRNNLAFYSLLMGSAIESASRMAESLYAAHPTDTAIVSTYALSLLRRGREGEALTALEKLPVEELRQASVAVYYAAALARNGQPDWAKEAARMVERENVLPEERNLLRESGLTESP